MAMWDRRHRLNHVRGVRTHVELWQSYKQLTAAERQHLAWEMHDRLHDATVRRWKMERLDGDRGEFQDWWRERTDWNKPSDARARFRELDERWLRTKDDKLGNREEKAMLRALRECGEFRMALTLGSAIVATHRTEIPLDYELTPEPENDRHPEHLVDAYPGPNGEMVALQPVFANDRMSGDEELWRACAS